MTDLTWVISSCVLILAVIALRAMFGKRMRPGLRYALWGLVLLRLLIPFEVSGSAWSVAAAVRRTSLSEASETVVAYRDIIPVQLNIPEPGPSLPEAEWRAQYEINQAEWEAEMAAAAREVGATPVTVADVLNWVWYAGIAVTVAVFLTSNLRFYNTLRKRRKPLETNCPLRVYSVESLSSSCLFGNAIYIAAETAPDETKLRHVLAHELSHHRHGDHVWALLRCAALALHWYNPLVWRAAALSRQDSELCADAGALRRLGEDERESYGATLIELSARRAPRAPLLCAATTMTNGKKSLKERVTMIARRPRMTVAVVIAVVMIAAVAAGCSFAGAKETDEPKPTVEAGQNTYRFYGDGWYLDAPYTLGEGENAVELTHTVRDTVTRGLFYVFRAGEDAALTVQWDNTPADVWFDPEISHWDEGFTLDPERRVVSYEFNGELSENYYVDAAGGGCYEITLSGTKYRDELWTMAESFTVDPSAKAVFEGSERLRGLLTDLAPADARLSFYDYDGYRGSCGGASAALAADYLAALAGVEWADADALDRGFHIDLEAPLWRLSCYQSGGVRLTVDGTELWLTARYIPDAPDEPDALPPYDALENWYQDALAAEQYRGSGTPLTADELRFWREELKSERVEYDESWGGYTGYATIASCFFTSYYSDPRGLDLAEFLAYCPLAEPVEDETEFDALHVDWEIGEEGNRHNVTLHEMPVPVHRYRVSRINEALTQYAGVTLDDLNADWRHDDRMLYAPECDAFYNFTSDFGPGQFFPRCGERSGDVVTLWSGHAVLTLRYMSGGGYQILSHLPDNGT